MILFSFDEITISITLRFPIAMSVKSLQNLSDICLPFEVHTSHSNVQFPLHVKLNVPTPCNASHPCHLGDYYMSFRTQLTGLHLRKAFHDPHWWRLRLPPTYSPSQHFPFVRLHVYLPHLTGNSCWVQSPYFCIPTTYDLDILDSKQIAGYLLIIN